MQNTGSRNTAQGFFSTRASAQHAVQLALPLLEQARQNTEIGESGFLYVVVMDPNRPYPMYEFEDAILYEHAVGDPNEWDADYGRFARDKARVSWRTGMDGHAVRYLQPYRLLDGDSGLWGGVCIDGIAIGVSGANPWFDEAFAATVAHCFKAVVKAKALSHKESPTL